MSLAARLQLRQSQALVMTPQLMQSIRLLQLTRHELDRFIDEEIEKNPLLSRDEGEVPFAASVDEGQSADGRSDGGFEAADDFSAEGIAGRLDTSLENLFPEDPGRRESLGPDLAMQWKSAGAGGAASADGFDMDDLAEGGATLLSHVQNQIALCFRDASDRLVALALAEELDDAGYCRANLSEVAARLGLDVTAVRRVLRTCQEFEPCGLFARDLADCLRLQLKARNRLDPAMEALLGRLDLLARRDFASLRRLCGVDEEDLLDMLAEIRALDPRPGFGFGREAADAVVADVEVREASDGSWSVELNPETLPRVLVDQAYFTAVSARTADGGERAFLGNCLQNANWLVRSLDQRARTILKVAGEIVRRQDAFLAHGIRHLRPLNLRAVADAIGMHESTVSRVTANKYMLTPRGVFELRFFFSAAIAAVQGGDSHSSASVQDRIRELIAGEAPSSVLSDDAIVVELKKNGVDIARRTVAKYREGMSIPSSVERRREKRAVAGLAD